MAYQYLYPSGDLVVNDWLNTDSGVPLYPYVDEGVDGANDLDFMRLDDSSPTFSGTLNYVTNGTFKFDMGELFCHPVLTSGGITANVRAKAPNGAWKFGDMYLHDASGSTIARHYGLVNVPSGTSYNDYEAKFENYPWLGAWDDYDLTNTTLLIHTASGNVETYVDMYISAVEVVSSGWIVGTNDSADLYIPGQFDYDEIPLYLHVWNPASGGYNPTLWIGGAFVQDVIPLYLRGLDSGEFGEDLYIGGHITEDANTTLYIRGFDVASGYMNLYIEGFGEEVYDDITLHTQAGVPSGEYGTTTIPLFITGVAHNEELPLYIAGPESEVTTTNMPLFIRRSLEWEDGDIPLFIENTLTWSGIPLYMCAPSGTDGAVPKSGELYLFIARSEESLIGDIPLYTSGPEMVYDDMELFVEGGPSLHGDITLVMPDVVGSESGVNPLYIHGF